MDLLGRRADVVAARWRVEAATRDVDNAKTLFYPNINLSGLIGLQSLGIGVVVDLRNIYNPDDMAKAGFIYTSIGRPTPAGGMDRG